ncbi:uncharacterized protein LOC131892839 [Tigriopus californicus]|uniref:uncharacterized protein LOC131892839 n=1 Tax=Tigriopus californicus TaxID=6832 RepID=UPI0027DA2704|nr:uncharacterized protein LOC131892839 [Tigriopus californicus]
MSVLRSIIQNDSVRLLLISLFAHLFGIIPYARQHCPYSFYYAGDSKLLLKNVLARQDRADQMADLYWRDKLQQDYRNLSDPWSELAVVVITTKRQKMDYLKRTLAAINENLIVKSQLKTGVMVCNTDIDFKSHGAVKSVSFAMTTYNVYQFRKKSFSNDLQKETHDFSICLNESLLHFRSDFFLVMEDDMIVLNESAKRLNTILAQLRGTEWTALKLFYPLTYQVTSQNDDNISTFINVLYSRGTN